MPKKKPGPLAPPFSPSLAHDILPLVQAISAYAGELGQSALGPSERALLSRLQGASALLSLTAENALFKEKGAVQTHRPFSLFNLLEDIRVGLSGYAGARGLFFRLAVEEGLPDSLEGDPRHLSRVLQNLVMNSLTGTEKGSVVLSVKGESRTGETARLAFQVRDTGPGFSHESGENKGLGLRIVRELLASLGGALDLFSPPEGGTIASFSLDFALSENQADLSGEEALPFKALIIDNDPVSRESLRLFLEAFASETREASGTEESLLLAESFQPDVIFMDVFLGNENGLSLARQLKDRGSLARMIGVSADSGLLQGPDSPFDSALVKPFTLRDLEKALGLKSRPQEEQPGESLPILDAEGLIEALPGQGERLFTLLYDYLEMLEYSEKEMSKWLEKEDWQSLGGKAHTLKGGALNLRLPRLSQVMAKLSNAASRSDRKGAQGLLARLSQERELLAEYLEKG